MYYSTQKLVKHLALKYLTFFANDVRNRLFFSDIEQKIAQCPKNVRETNTDSFLPLLGSPKETIFELLPLHVNEKRFRESHYVYVSIVHWAYQQDLIKL